MRTHLITVFVLLSLLSVAHAEKRKIPFNIPEHELPVVVGAPALADGAVVPLTLVNKVAVKKAKPGDQVEFRVADDVRWRDQIVIAKGTTAMANVTEARGAKWPSRGSALVLTLHSVTAVDGTIVPLRSATTLKGGVNTVAGAAWALTLGTREFGLFFAPAAIALSLTTRGHNENAPAGMHQLAFVDGEFVLANTKPSATNAADTGTVWIGLAPRLYRAIIYCNGIPVSRLDRKRVLRLELPAGYYRFGFGKEVSQEIYVVAGQEHALLIDSSEITPIPADWSKELKARKPENPEHKFVTPTTCTPLPEKSPAPALLPEKIKSDVLIHQPGPAGNEVGDVAKQ